MTFSIVFSIVRNTVESHCSNTLGPRGVLRTETFGKVKQYCFIQSRVCFHLMHSTILGILLLG